ncbi:MAG TPA: lasso peptide biosynthesis B2 protein [Solirubrobacteraceae bacterium]|nr:lasso peptide biosynthesis B2 protein [Solirubrobacteraceae bacterium]
MRRRAALALEILAAYASVRRLLWRRDFPEALAAVRGVRARRTAEGDPRAVGRGLGRAVARTLTPLPADSRCLVRSLVLLRLLARRDIPARLVLGVTPGERFAAHAWVEQDGVPVLSPGGFERLAEL